MDIFDQWWNSQAADAFRAAHEDADGEQFRCIWDAAQRAINESLMRAKEEIEMLRADRDSWMQQASWRTQEALELVEAEHDSMRAQAARDVAEACCSVRQQISDWLESQGEPGYAAVVRSRNLA